MKQIAREVFRTRNENGLQDWTKCGGLWGEIDDNPPYNVVSHEEFGGRHWIRSEIVDPTVDYNPPRQRSRAEIERKGYLDCSARFVDEHDDLLYGANLLLPSDFHVTEGTGDWLNGCSLIQLKETDPDHWSGGFRIRRTTTPQTFRVQFRRYNYDTGKMEYKNYAYPPLIRGRKFPVVFRVRSTIDGKFQCWVNNLDQPVCNENMDCRLHPIGVANGHKSRYIKYGIYCGLNQNRKQMWSTDHIVVAINGDFNAAFNMVRTFLGKTPTPTSPIRVLQAITRYLGPIGVGLYLWKRTE